MVNVCELLINAVNHKEPKDADRLYPKGKVAGYFRQCWKYTDNKAIGEQAGPKPFVRELCGT
jgi:hypothetical protein